MSAGTLSNSLQNALRSFPASRAAGAEIGTLLAQTKNRAAGATFTIGDEDTNVREIEIQVTDENGDAISHVFCTRLFVFADAAGAALATGGSTGVALGTTVGAGILISTDTAKLAFTVATDADGTLSIKWTDTGTEAVYLALLMPNGTLAFSGEIANSDS